MKLKLLPITLAWLVIACSEIRPEVYEKPIEINQGAIEMLGDGESAVVKVTSTKPWELTFSDGSWLYASHTSGDYTAKVIITSDRNPSETESRVDTAFFNSDGISRFVVITQNKFEEYVICSLDGTTYTPAAGEVTSEIPVKVTSNQAWTVDCPEWVAASKTSGEKNGIVTFTIDNTDVPGPGYRTGIVTIKSPGKETSFTIRQQSTYANTYIIKGSGSYSFKVGKPDGTMPGNVTAADWLFASHDGLISGVNYSDGKISYTINSTVGGYAAIAVYDGDNIVWTYMVWVTPALGEYKIGDVTVLDRNIGAWTNNLPLATFSTQSDPSAYGCYFQWGRPCGFPGPAARTNILKTNADRESTGFSTATWSCVFNTSRCTGFTTGKAAGALVASPMQFQTTNYSATADGGDLWTDEKSNYDPCPAGYKVPSKEEIGNIISMAGWTKAQPYGNSYSRVYSLSSNEICFPSMSYRLGASGKLYATGRSAGYWSATKSSETKANCNFDFVANTYDLFTGFGVRCVKID